MHANAATPYFSAECFEQTKIKKDVLRQLWANKTP
jgi:hypothetical protein